MTDLLHAALEAAGKIAAMGLFALAIVIAAALATRADNRRIAEQQTRRMFAGNRRPSSTSTEGRAG